MVIIYVISEHRSILTLVTPFESETACIENLFIAESVLLFVDVQVLDE